MSELTNRQKVKKLQKKIHYLTFFLIGRRYVSLVLIAKMILRTIDKKSLASRKGSIRPKSTGNFLCYIG